MYSVSSEPPTQNDTTIIKADIDRVIAAAAGQYEIEMAVRWSEFSSVTSEEYNAAASELRHRQLMSQTKRDLVGADLFVWQLYFDVLVVLPPWKGGFGRRSNNLDGTTVIE